MPRFPNNSHQNKLFALLSECPSANILRKEFRGVHSSICRQLCTCTHVRIFSVNTLRAFPDLVRTPC